MSTRACRAARRHAGYRTRPARHRGTSALRATTIALLVASAFATAASANTGSAGEPGAAAAIARGAALSFPDGTHPSLDASPGALHPLATPGELLAPGQLEELLAKLPLGDLSAAQLAHYLAGLPDISVLASLHVGLLGTEELGVAALEESLRKGIETLGAGATIGELANTSELLPAVEAKLDGLLTALLGSNLGAEQQQQLSAALGALDLDQLVGALLGSAREPAQLNALSDLAGALFEELGAAPLEGLLGAPLSGGFAPTTVENVASELHTTPEAVSDELGQTAAQLPATATLLTAPVTSGKLLAVAPAVKGLALGLLGAAPGEGTGNGSGEGGGEGAAGSGEGKGGGSSSGSGSGTGGSGEGGGGGAPGAGGNGGQGSSGGAAGLTLVIDTPSGPTVPAAAAAGKKGAPRKIAILGAKTRGAVATILLRAPAAGRLILRGRGLTTSSRTLARGARVTLTVRLSRAGAARLRRHRRPLKVQLRASFKTAAGASSSTTTTLSFR
jgi:hypothetical protein